MHRWGIIGVGVAGRARARAIQADPRGEVTTSYRGDPEPVDIPSVGRLDDLWDQVDAVAICSPDHTHPDMVRQALDHGKHVVCEFPLARTGDEAQALFDAAQKAGRILHVEHIELLSATAQWWRQNPPRSVTRGRLAFTSSRTGVDVALGNLARLHRIIDILGMPTDFTPESQSERHLQGTLRFDGSTPIVVDFRFGPGLPRETTIELITGEGDALQQKNRAITKNRQPVELPAVGPLFAADQQVATARILDGASGYVSEAHIVETLRWVERLSAG
ncbi:MAG: Gfo/Idh/MocA family oxidoreductase [Myxococcota bacterium]